MAGEQNFAFADLSNQRLERQAVEALAAVEGKEIAHMLASGADLMHVASEPVVIDAIERAAVALGVDVSVVAPVAPPVEEPQQPPVPVEPEPSAGDAVSEGEVGAEGETAPEAPADPELPEPSMDPVPPIDAAPSPVIEPVPVVEPAVTPEASPDLPSESPPVSVVEEPVPDVLMPEDVAPETTIIEDEEEEA